MQLIFVSGLSGAGKTVALQMLEDLGFYCIDNIPAGLLRTFVRHAVEAKDSAFARTAVGIDARNRSSDIDAVPQLFEKLRSLDIDFDVIFIHADVDVLLSRYRETRRKHPLSGAGRDLRDAIAEETAILDPVAREADYVIDSSRTSVHELRELIRARVDRDTDSGRGMSLQIESFGFKSGIPGDADFVFDVRCLPNPHWEKSLRELSGLDQPVVDFLDAQEDANRMYDDIVRFLEDWLPRFAANNRSYLTIAIGCTGGQHRSVYMTQRLARHFADKVPNVICRHTALK